VPQSDPAACGSYRSEQLKGAGNPSFSKAEASAKQSAQQHVAVEQPIRRDATQRLAQLGVVESNHDWIMAQNSL
jgi:hypothetical protein